MTKKPKCTFCGSHAVLFDAWAIYDSVKDDFEVHNLIDRAFCIRCRGECSVEWTSAA